MRSAPWRGWAASRGRRRSCTSASPRCPNTSRRWSARSVRRWCTAPLAVEPFVEDHVVLFVATGHPLSTRKELFLPELMDAGLIVREPGSATRATGERALRAAGVEPRFAMELGSNEAVKRAVLAGLGI